MIQTVSLHDFQRLQIMVKLLGEALAAHVGCPVNDKLQALDMIELIKKHCEETSHSPSIMMRARAKIAPVTDEAIFCKACGHGQVRSTSTVCKKCGINLYV